jgi:uncharacterized protein (DUF2147 family)
MKMKGFSHAITGLTAVFTVFSGAAAAMARPEDAIGHWATPSKHGVVEIVACGTSVCGRLIESDSIRTNPDMRDAHNGDAARRNRPLKGLMLLEGFHRGANGWDGGTIYNPEDGGTYHATITLSGPDKLNLKGCVVWPLCKNQTWQRIR